MARKMEQVASDPDLDGRLEAMEQDAERELAERPADGARVNFRWGQEQLALVKQAAALMGVPYQTYIKQAAFRQAAADLQAVRSIQ